MEIIYIKENSCKIVLYRCYLQSLCIIDDCLCRVQPCSDIMFFWRSPISPFIPMMTNQVWAIKAFSCPTNFMKQDVSSQWGYHGISCKHDRGTFSWDTTGGPDCIQSMLGCNMQWTIIPITPKLLCKIPKHLILMQIDHFYECISMFQHSLIIFYLIFPVNSMGLIICLVNQLFISCKASG